MQWSHKLRGFRDGFSPSYNRHENPLDSDYAWDVLRRHDLDLKVPLLSDVTDYQHVDIIELIDPMERSLTSYERSLADDEGGSYESINKHMFRADKVLYLDGVLQSSLNGEAEYHEALVHPSMIAHPYPKRVAIIGGGEGATLREVLKHKSVEEVVMVEIDEELVEMCAEHLPEWSDCSDISGVMSCFDDPRATLVFMDAFKWFIDKFGDDDGGNEEEKFDVIIMDALDPDRLVEIVGSLYEDNHFVVSLFNGLTKDGVVSYLLGYRIYPFHAHVPELISFLSCSSSCKLARVIITAIPERTMAHTWTHIT